MKQVIISYRGRVEEGVGKAACSLHESEHGVAVCKALLSLLSIKVIAVDLRRESLCQDLCLLHIFLLIYHCTVLLSSWNVLMSSIDLLFFIFENASFLFFIIYSILFYLSVPLKHAYTRSQIKNDQPGSHDFRRFLRQFSTVIFY